MDYVSDHSDQEIASDSEAYQEDQEDNSDDEEVNESSTVDCVREGPPATKRHAKRHRREIRRQERRVSERYYCFLCKKVYNPLYQMRVHNSDQHRGYGLECAKCRNVFGSRRLKELHVQTYNRNCKRIGLAAAVAAV